MDGVIAGVIWLVIAVALCFLESMTVQLICIWFAGGAFVAMGAAFFGAPLNLQLVLFVITSVLVLVFGRPFLKERLTPKKTATNVDALIGESGVVTEDISFDQGRVQAGGLSWAARPALDDMKIPAGAVIRILAIDGVKLIVEPQNAKANLTINSDNT
jgi:membrane protein implicated in regulation of membrane protease activity